MQTGRAGGDRAMSAKARALWSVGIPDDLVLTPIARWPTTLEEASMRAVLDAPIERRVGVRERVVDAEAPPRISIVIVTLDGLVFNRLCLETLLAVPTSIAFEAIVVDNGSTDGTVAYLGELAARDARVRVMCNGRNAGFAAATNRGAAAARGALVVLLNNDTIVTAGWLERIADHLADARIGLLGAVTNRAGNEAEIDVSYRTYGELREFARAHMEAHVGERFDIRTVTMFCAAMRRDVLEAIGPLDERFEIGLFEDDDYAMRMRLAGYRVVCAEDLFVHHFGQASIGRLGPTGQYGAVFHANRARWEEKWGVAWQPYERREKPAYRDLVSRIRQLVSDAVPAGARIAVISKGDAELLRLDGHQAWHFPEGADGAYAGHYPADSGECIAELERLRAKGAEYLVIPETARWWLQHYAQFGAHLQAHYGAIADEPSAATIVALSGMTGSGVTGSGMTGRN
jgi:GT2 family glycosyltransferase